MNYAADAVRENPADVARRFLDGRPNEPVRLDVPRETESRACG